MLSKILKTRKSNLCVAIMLCSSIVLSSTVAAQPLQTQWLYLSNSGSWIARSEVLIHQQTHLNLPVNQLTAAQFWWQTELPGTQLTWNQPDPNQLPKLGTTVEVDGLSGLWLVQGSSPTHLVLQQGKFVRYWPQSQWHLLQWSHAADYGMELTVLQSKNQSNALFYAWQDHRLTAQVRYRLEQSKSNPTLVQELIVSNLTDSDFEAPGYSYAEQAQRPMMAARTSMAESNVQTLATPQSSQSQGVPTLISSEPVLLQAGSHIWLPISSHKLSSVSRHYQLQWNTQQQGLQTSQMDIQLTSNTDLPTISGPIKVGVFDQQVPLQESYYQAGDKNTVNLSMGSSSLVSMNSKQVSEGRWLLVVSNRTESLANISLLTNHWDGKSNQQLPLDMKLDAQATTTFDLELDKFGKIRIAK